MRKTEAARLAKLNDLLGRLRRGEIVQNRQLRVWLSEAGYKEYKESWSNAVDQRNLLSQKPGEIADYEALLKKATMLHNRGAASRNNASARRFGDMAQSAFERALRYLEEALGRNPSLSMWLDRPCDFGAGGNLSLDPVGMPRAVTSRSLDNLGSATSFGVTSKRDTKIKAVEAEIDRIVNPPAQSTDDIIAEKLRALDAARRK